MSRSLLAKLNGSNHGEFAKWLENHPWEPRIAWYPSCGHDFSDLIYLHKSETRRSFRQVPQAPEIFIHTDCSIPIRSHFPFHSLHIHSDRPIHCDERTRVSVISNEELPTLDISSKACDDGYSQFGASPDYGRVFFLRLHIESDRLGSILQPVLYAIVENGAFASQVLLETDARITHIWNVLPGGKPSPWIGYLLKRLKTECLVRETGFYSEKDLEYQRQEYFTCFPNLAGDNEDVPDPAGWAPVGSFSGREKRVLNCFRQKESRREREMRTLDMLCARSDVWRWLELNYGAQFYHFNRHGTAYIVFSEEKPSRNIHTDLYPQRREVAKSAAEGFAHASGDTYFEHFPCKRRLKSAAGGAEWRGGRKVRHLQIKQEDVARYGTMGRITP